MRIDLTIKKDPTKKVGKFEINSKAILGKGNHGAFVYKGYWCSMSSKMPVAVKQFPAKFLSHEELMMNKRLEHENVAGYLAKEIKANVAYFALELCAGNLENLINKSYNGPSPGSIIEVLRQATLGLHYLHSKKVIHGNLKPSNILISLPPNEGQPKIKLADFGVIRKSSDPNTLGWRAPECHEDINLKHVNDMADVFSLGCVFAFSLSEGNHPFGNDENIRAQNIKLGKINSTYKESKKIDPNFKAVIERMIAHDEGNRPTLDTIVQSSIFRLSLTKHSSMQNISSKPNQNITHLSRIQKDGTPIGDLSSTGAKIYECLVNGQLRAIKRINKRTYTANYGKEIEIMMKPVMSNCQYLVRYFSCEEDRDFCYIEMELCTDSLYSFVQVKRRMSTVFDGNLMKKKIFMKNIIEGIAFLHDTVGLVHRDIKPTNVLIFKEGNLLVPKIADYGISELSEGDRTLNYRGTEGWMAPEIKATSSYTKAVDIFALGCLLFYVETEGGHPFGDNSSANIGREAQRNIDTYNPNIEALSTIEPTMADLLCRALEQEPKQRITASKMLDHHAFSSAEVSLYFLRWAVEQHGNKLDGMFRDYAEDFVPVIINSDWRESLEDEIFKEASLGPNRKRLRMFEDPNFGKSIYNLIGLIRNKYAHYCEVSPEAKEIMGPIPDKYFEYWRQNFPHLLVNTYNVCLKIERPEMLKGIHSNMITQFRNRKIRKEAYNGGSGGTTAGYKPKKETFENTSVFGFLYSVGKRIFGADRSLVQTRGVGAKKTKKSFFDFLTDRCAAETCGKKFGAITDLDTFKKELVHRLRHRIDISVSDDDDYQPVKQTNSFYDTLLELLDEYDPSGVCEIFDLLIESKFTVPLFNPLTYQHYLLLLKEIHARAVNNGPAITLGNDTSLNRVVLISSRKQCETQTLDLLKYLFNLNTLHQNDSYFSGLQHKFTVDVGIGYIGRRSTNQLNESDSDAHVLVVHVFGQFENVMDFVNGFADVLLVEDDASTESFATYAKNKGVRDNQGNPVKILLWKPTNKTQPSFVPAVDTLKFHGFTHARVSAQYGEKLVSRLSAVLRDLLKNRRLNRKRLSQLTLLENETLAFANGIHYSDVTNRLRELVPKVAKTRSSFALQRNFCEQSQHEEMKRENRLKDDERKLAESNIDDCIKRRNECAQRVGELDLIKYFLDILNGENQSTRVMNLRHFEQTLSHMTEEELEMLQTEINSLYAKLANSGAHVSNEQFEDANTIKKAYVKAKLNYRDSMLHIEHLWRELSHLYASNPKKYLNLPRLAAQHMLDGFSLELLDGDANLMNLTWVNEVLAALGNLIIPQKRRIFVLSVMGIQSSGKSTLLNTMFGVRMRTSVGQCTRGINMQLVPVEGRAEYDYVLILDTEGTRSPDYYGMYGNEKRDNQMATLSILLADATIIVNPGENDAAVKEILPIVLMAYQNSKLAEDTSGRLSSMMFFIYNRIDTTQREKLTSIIQNLSNSLLDAFKTVQEKTGCKPRDLIDPAAENANLLFRHFVLDASNSAGSDVRILGQNKKSCAPPDNVPDSTYGETLVEFREHIHKRVTQPRDGVKWRSHSTEQLASYLKGIWECICSADFNFQFKHIVERAAFDQLEADYQKIERKLAWQYQKQFCDVRKTMVKDEALSSIMNALGSAQRDEHCSSLQQKLESAISQVTYKLDMEFSSLVNPKERERWRLSYEDRWKSYKNKQGEFWDRQLRQSYDTVFYYNKQVDNLKNSLRQAISTKYLAGWFGPSSQLEMKFEDIMKEHIEKAERVYPSVNVKNSVYDLYAKSPTIQSHQIQVSQPQYEKVSNEILAKLSGLNQADQTKVQSAVLKEVKALWTMKTMKENQEFTACLLTIKQHLLTLLDGVQCYDESIISVLIEKTDSALQQGVFNIQNSHRELAHTFARLLVTARMQEIQTRWEVNNSVPAKLKSQSTRDAMWEFFQTVSGGAKTIKLFALIIKEKFANLQEAYRTEVTAITVKRIKEQRFITSVSWLQYRMEDYLAKITKNKHINEVINYVKCPQDLRTTVLYNLVADMARHALKEKYWDHYVKDLIGAIKYATRSALDGKINRASRFLIALRKCLSESLVSDGFIVSLSNLGYEYSEIDNESPSEFRAQVLNFLVNAIKQQSSPVCEFDEFINQITELTIETLRRSSGPGALAWCDHCCPWCGSLCNRQAGHEALGLLHNTVHQPAGLVGREFGSLEILEARACSDFEPNDMLVGKTTDDDESGKSFLYRNWRNVFSDWDVPYGGHRSLVREYIFYHHHKEFASHYGFNPSPSVPSWYNRDLSTILQTLYFKASGN